MERMPGFRRNTIAEGSLIKLNLQQCPCGSVYVSPQQASKVPDVTPGWYDDLATTRDAFEQSPDVDPVIRISPGNRGRKICPTCREKKISAV